MNLFQRDAKQVYALFLLGALCLSSRGLAEPIGGDQRRVVMNDDDFRHVFATAGYSAALGAASGAALLPFLPDSPVSNLRYVAGGASIGFLLGSIVGLYNVSQGASTYQRSQDYYYYAPDSDIGTPSAEVSLVPHKRALPRGALIVGNGDETTLSIPDFFVAPQLYQVSLVKFQF